jgi:hypothetical protein
MQQFPLKNPEENQRVYRAKMVELLQLARKYDGTEENYVRTMRKLIGFEKWLVEAFGKNEGKEEKFMRLSDQIEKDLARTMEVKSERTIADIMDLMSKRASQVIFNNSAKIDEQPSLEKLKIVKVELNGVLLPADEFTIEDGKGGGIKQKEIRFEQRLEKLLNLLNHNGIFLDDLIICSGKLTPNQRRQESYYLVEIPRLNKEVLVCQQVEEATFVINGIFSRETFMTLSKKQLQETYSDKVTRVVFHNERQWEKELLEVLLNKEVGKKIDVKSQESLKEAVLELLPTAEDWVGLHWKQRRAFKIGGLGLNALATKFAVNGNVLSNYKFYLELGRKIYGDDQKALKFEEVPELPLEELKMAILEKYPTAEGWAALSTIQKRALKIGGLGIVALAGTFGVKGDPANYHKFHLELGRKIYGDDQIALKFEEVPELSLEEFKMAILEKYPTAEGWAVLPQKQRAIFKIGGYGLNAIARKFSVDGDVVGFRKFYLELGRKIYGDDQKALKFEEVPELSLEELKMAILERCPTAEEWAALSTKQKTALKVNGLGLEALGKKFGVKGNARSYRQFYLELGRKIYGENQVFQIKNSDNLDG